MANEGEASAAEEPSVQLTLDEQVRLHEKFDHGAVARRGSVVTVITYKEAEADALESKRKLAQPDLTKEEREFHRDKFQETIGGWATRER